MCLQDVVMYIHNRKRWKGRTSFQLLYWLVQSFKNLAAPWEMMQSRSSGYGNLSWLITFFTFSLITTMAAASHLVNACVTASLEPHIAKRRQMSRNAPEWCGTTVQWNTGSGQNDRNGNIIKKYQISIRDEYWFSYISCRSQHPHNYPLESSSIHHIFDMFTSSYILKTPYPPAIEFRRAFTAQGPFLQISSLLPLHDLPSWANSEPGEPFK